MRIRGFEQGDKFAVMRFELFRVEFLRRYVGVVDADAENGKIRPDKFQVFGQMAAAQPGRYVGPVNPYGMIDQSVPVVSGKMPVSVKRPPSPVWMRMSAVSQASG